MFNFPAWGPEWAAIFGALWFALLIGKVTRQQSVVLMSALIGALLTESWVGCFVGAVIVLTLWPLDLVRKVGS